MSIKPIDMQVMIPKTSEVSKMHHDEMQRNIALQQQQAMSLRQKAEDGLKQVYQQNKAYGAEIRENQEKNRGNGKGGKKGNRKARDAESEIHETKTSVIDIKI